MGRVVAAVDWLGGSGIRLVNMSLETDEESRAGLRHGQRRRQRRDPGGRRRQWRQGCAPRLPRRPSTIIAVTAIDADARIYKKANRGDYINLAAPGVDVWAAKAGGGGSYRFHTLQLGGVPFVVAAIAIEQSAMPAPRHCNCLPICGPERRTFGAKGHDPIYGDGLLTAPKSCGGTAASN